jgi:acetylornithine deacetylase/succinyl-diaminopimelate desuccinylase-like protein
MELTCEKAYRRPEELLRQLIRFDTTNPPGNEAPCIQYIDQLLQSAGYQTALFAKDPNRPNLITRLKGQGKAPGFLLYGHVDVVTTIGQAWTHPPFEGKIADGYIWGRGALDMKSGVAMMVASLLRAAVEGLKPAGDIVLAVLSDEEAGGTYGARFLVENHAEQFAGIRYAIGEFGGFPVTIGGRTFTFIQVSEKQPCLLEVTAHGSAGHGARPMRGGTMAKLARLLDRLDHHRLPVHITPPVRRMIETMAKSLPLSKRLAFRSLLVPTLTDRALKLFGRYALDFEPLFHNTVNATMVRGGGKPNVIPSEVRIGLDGRILPGYTLDDLITELRTVIGDETEPKVLYYHPGPVETDFELLDALVDVLTEAQPETIPVPYLLPGTTDARFISKLGIQCYGCTPMNLPSDFNFFETIHAADERIPVGSVRFGADVLYRLLELYGQ